jgi:hypothetical protein
MLHQTGQASTPEADQQSQEAILQGVLLANEVVFDSCSCLIHALGC